MTKLFDIARWVKNYIFHKSFFLGLCLLIGILSVYIFGPNNLTEKITELFVYENTGIFIDFTPRSPESVSNDFQEILELSEKYGGCN